MLEVVFSDSAAGTMAVAIGHKGFLGGATSVIISDGTVSKEEIEKFQHQAEERERSGWENAIPLEGNRKDIVNLPLALSVGNISEAGICLTVGEKLNLITWDGWHLLGRSCQQITFVVWLTAGENSNRKILLFVLL